MKRRNINFETVEMYHLDRWSLGYYCISPNGHLMANTTPDAPVIEQENQQIDLVAITREIKKKGLTFPVVVRFHDILRSRVTELFSRFAQTIQENNYKGQYFGVFPIKVNQVREVVEEIVDAGKEFNLGLEAGSKSELLALLSFDLPPKAVIILNGYKDEQTLRLALLAKVLGRNIFVVIEKFSELETLVKLIKESGTQPDIGIRVKLTSKGSGRWASSTGRAAKFGLTISEMLKAIQLLREHSLEHSFKLLHFHIGSQIPNIRIFKDALTEIARIYAQLKKHNLAVEYIDIGGGLGINYDGAHNNLQGSINYGQSDYIESVVSILQQICDLEDVAHPHIISESGRAITAHHSCIITNVFGEKSPRHMENHLENLENLKGEKKHILLKNMIEVYENLDQANTLETYHTTDQILNDSYNAFKLGLLSIEEWSEIETLYNLILQTIYLYRPTEIIETEEFKKIKKLLASQYLCNFSVFQSTVDCWAIEQLLPIVPLQRLDEMPTVDTVLVDITCDSDGKIKHYLNSEGGSAPMNTLKLHKLSKDEDYYIGIFLTGAYQDVMGDMHNLFGRLNEVHVYADEQEDDGFYIEEVIAGNRASDVLKIMQYNPSIMARQVKKEFDQLIKDKKIMAKKGIEFANFYEQSLQEYTYLK